MKHLRFLGQLCIYPFAAVLLPLLFWGYLLLASLADLARYLRARSR